MADLNERVQAIVKEIVGVVNAAVETGAASGADRRRAEKASMVRVTLGPEHLAGAELLPSRETLLEVLPKGGIVAEVGVADGDFSEKILQTVNPTKLYLVDLWGDPRYQNGFLKVRARFADDPRVEILRGESTAVLARMTEWASGTLDWVYIDTTHSWDGTRAELPLAARLIRPGGLLCGDDHCTGNVITPVPYGVIEAVQEFCVRDGWAYRYLTMDRAGHASFALRRL